jgi:hypothetical protein
MNQYKSMRLERPLLRFQELAAMSAMGQLLT